MVYGKNVVFPIEFQLKTLRIVVEVGLDITQAQQDRLNQIHELDEMQQVVVHPTYVIQQQRDKWHDQFIKKKHFQVGDWALLYDSIYKYFQGKFRTRWLGPYEVDIVFPNGIVQLQAIDVEIIHLL